MRSIWRKSTTRAAEILALCLYDTVSKVVGEPAAVEDHAGSADLAELLRRYQEAELEAASELVRHVSPRIFHFLLAQVRDRSLAEDLLQDFWLRVHKARHTYRIDEPLWPWLFAIARHVQIDGYRRRSRISRHEYQTEPIPEVAAASKSGTAEESSTVLDMLKTLPPNQREAVLLLKVTGLTLEEAALAIGVSVGAVKQRAHRAFEKLRTVFGQSDVGTRHEQ